MLAPSVIGEGQGVSTECYRRGGKVLALSVIGEGARC